MYHMELIDRWSHSTNTLALVTILLVVLVALVASGLSIVPTTILLCVGLIAILWRSSLASRVGNETNPESDDSLDTVREQYIEGEIAEDELEHQLTATLDEKKADNEQHDRDLAKEQE